MAFRKRVEAALEGRQYRIERELGRGAMGRVYLARDLRHDRHVAVKVLDPGITTSTGGARFLREIQIIASLQHPHILPLLDSGESGGLVFYIMPHVEGETLRDHLNREKQLSVEEAVRIAGEIAAALQYAHAQSIVHRDIKPDNILLSAGLAMVADFGIARALSSRKTPRATSAGLALGTPAYMSPEQVAGEEIDHRADIYALGAVLFEMLAGRPPFVADTLAATLHRKLTEPTPLLSSLRPGLPPSLDAVVQRAMAREPDRRFQSAEELRAALVPLEAREALAGTPLDSPKLSPASSQSKTRRGLTGTERFNRGIIWGGLVSIVVIVALLLIPPGGSDEGSRGDESRTGDSASSVATDSVWGARPLAGTILAPDLALPDGDGLAREVAGGLWDSVSARLRGRLTVATRPDPAGSSAWPAASATIRGSVRRDGRDVVATFDWHERPDGPRYWSESYHVPPGEAASIRRAIMENLTRALSRSTPPRADSTRETTP